MEEFENNELHEDTPLTKEEILERNRAENKNGDEREKSNNQRAAIFALFVMLGFVLVTSILEAVFSKQYIYSYSLMAMCWGVTGTIWLARGILNRKPLEIFLGGLGFVTCAISYFLFIVNLLKVVG